ncbi:MAG: 6-phosphofructokinase [Candidatus Manganitrophus sp. SA1]|nr:6-phosphofructokinase [Candidatus Manganitrophus morganii]
MESQKEELHFVTVEGLVAYGEAMTRRTPPEGVTFPPPLPATADRVGLAREAISKVRAFVDRTQEGFPDAEAYRTARHVLINEGCGGDLIVFFAAWNALLAEGGLAPLLRGPIGSVQKPLGRRPVAIVPRTQLTPQLAEGRIVLDLGDDRFWLLPRNLTGRSLLFTMRHGVSRIESKTHRVGCRLANTLELGKGLSKADAVGAALARMVGVVGQQLDFLHLENYLDPKSFKHLISSSPNTRQLFERVSGALISNYQDVQAATVDPALASQDFGWVTGLEKAAEAEEAGRAFGVDAKSAKRLIKNPLYCYPGGNSFLDLYVDVVDGIHQIARSHQGGVASLYTHSSTLRALITYLDPRPFHEAFSEFGEYKEGQDNVVLLAYENGHLSGYSTAVGLSERERTAREAWISVERERAGRVTLRPNQLRQVVALVSGGDFAGAGAALKELRACGDRLGIAVHFVRHGFLGLANNWIEQFTEREMRGMAGVASSPIGSSRFEDFKDEEVQRGVMRNLAPYLENGALVVMGGDGSLRGARVLFEKFGVQVVGLPGTIDDNLAGTTSLGFHSAVALANHSLESLKATSAAMGSIFFVEVMGAGAGHLALACAYQARAEGILVNEHPDPDTYIDQVILGNLKRSMGVPNKSHLFVVAEKTPHRHHPLGGVHGLVDYIAQTIAKWPSLRTAQGQYPLTVATKATILGHTLRGAPPTPLDRTLAQHFAYETLHRLVERPESAVGCLLVCRGEGPVEAIPLHSITPKPFDWELFSRMHGNINTIRN